MTTALNQIYKISSNGTTKSASCSLWNAGKWCVRRFFISAQQDLLAYKTDDPSQWNMPIKPHLAWRSVNHEIHSLYIDSIVRAPDFPVNIEKHPLCVKFDDLQLINAVVHIFNAKKTQRTNTKKSSKTRFSYIYTHCTFCLISVTRQTWPSKSWTICDWSSGVTWFRVLLYEWPITVGPDNGGAMVLHTRGKIENYFRA
jgi:hypothetical protein